MIINSFKFVRKLLSCLLCFMYYSLFYMLAHRRLLGSYEANCCCWLAYGPCIYCWSEEDMALDWRCWGWPCMLWCCCDWLDGCMPP